MDFVRVEGYSRGFGVWGSGGLNPLYIYYFFIFFGKKLYIIVIHTPPDENHPERLKKDQGGKPSRCIATEKAEKAEITPTPRAK